MFEDQNLILDSLAKRVHKKDLFLSNNENKKERKEDEYNPYVNNNGTVLGIFILFLF